MAPYIYGPLHICTPYIYGPLHSGNRAFIMSPTAAHPQIAGLPFSVHLVTGICRPNKIITHKKETVDIELLSHCTLEINDRLLT